MIGFSTNWFCENSCLWDTKFGAGIASSWDLIVNSWTGFLTARKTESGPKSRHYWVPSLKIAKIKLLDYRKKCLRREKNWKCSSFLQPIAAQSAYAIYGVNFVLLRFTFGCGRLWRRAEILQQRAGFSFLQSGLVFFTERFVPSSTKRITLGNCSLKGIWAHDSWFCTDNSRIN